MLIFSLLIFLKALYLLYILIKYCKRLFVKISFNNKVVWITGASSGLGEALAYEFSKLGASLILTARNVKEVLSNEINYI